MIREDIAFIEKSCQWRFRGSVTGLRTTPKIFTALPVDLGTKLSCDSVTDRIVVVGFNNPTSFPMEFTNVSAQSTQNTVRIDKAPFIVPPGGDRSVVIVLNSSISQGSLTDTLLLPFESDACEGLFKVPVVLRMSSVTVNQPKTLSFDTLKSNVKPITRSLPVTATLAGAPQTIVQYVEITEPFTTSMKPGLVLPHNRATSVNVTLDPKSIVVDGPVKGTLRYLLDSCAVPYEVQLNASVIVVGVDDEQGAGSARISVSDDGIVVTDAPGRVEVFDLRGQMIASGQSELGYIRLGGLATGCYLVTVHDEVPLRMKTTITCIVR
jgi:hypothetical protein